MNESIVPLNHRKVSRAGPLVAYWRLIWGAHSESVLGGGPTSRTRQRRAVLGARRTARSLGTAATRQSKHCGNLFPTPRRPATSCRGCAAATPAVDGESLAPQALS
jgi:hypothetical protein